MTRKVQGRSAPRAVTRVSKPGKKASVKLAKKPSSSKVMPQKPASQKAAARSARPAKTKQSKVVGKSVAAVKIKPEKPTTKSKTAGEVVKVKKPRAKKLPPRMRVRWCVFDGMMKQVAVFDYNKKAEAQASLAQFLEKKPTYFLQLVKEPMPVAVEEVKAGK